MSNFERVGNKPDKTVFPHEVALVMTDNCGEDECAIAGVVFVALA